jgi:uncharacterized protein YjbI with pentapeptide repeats
MWVFHMAAGEEGSSMANQEHLDLLKRGVQVWNQWRQDHPEIQPYLVGSDLVGMNLRNANLNGANLFQADFGSRETFIRGVEANIFVEGAGLEGADLRNANLVRVNLSDISLQEVNLSGADLRACKKITFRVPSLKSALRRN